VREKERERERREREKESDREKGGSERRRGSKGTLQS
jgi:hypothetical protein